MTDNWKEITDPEELFRLKREGWEIEVLTDGWEIEVLTDNRIVWCGWNGLGWARSFHYRARPPQPKMKKVKMLAYLDARAELRWAADEPASTGWIRIPAEDKTIEVPDDN